MTSVGRLTLREAHAIVPSELVGSADGVPTLPAAATKGCEPLNLAWGQPGPSCISWKDWSVEEEVCCSGVVRRPLGPPYHIAASLREASVVCTPAEPKKRGEASRSSISWFGPVPEPSWS